jgi:hypothetical protein
MRLALLLAATLAIPPGTEVLVLRSGARIKVAGAVDVQANKAVFRDPAGAFYSVDVSEIDLEATATRGSRKPSAGSAPTPTPAAGRKLAVSAEEKARLLKELSLSRGQPAPRPKPEEASPKASPTPEPSKKAENEDEWRARGKAAQGAVDRAKNDIELLQRREDELESMLLMLRGYGDEMLTAQLLELERTRTALEYGKQNLVEAERAWFDLQEEARVKDVLPGWLR